jgi:hypothetical protein
MWMLNLPMIAALAVTGPVETRNDFHWSGSVAAGKTVEIRGVRGDVVANHTSGAEVIVTAKIRGRRGDPGGVRIEVVPHPGGVTLCAVYPPRDAGRSDECKPGGGRTNGNNNDVQVDFRVQVPAGVHFNGSTVNGRVEARGLGGEVRASTVNGDVQVSATGPVEGKTVNGNIVVSIERAGWTRDLDFSTVNGGITLELPAGARAEVAARTVTGGIRSDYPIGRRGVSGKRAGGSIGAPGGPRLTMSTVNGSIRLKVLQAAI